MIIFKFNVIIVTLISMLIKIPFNLFAIIIIIRNLIYFIDLSHNAMVFT
jgi:hypothetical protein